QEIRGDDQVNEITIARPFIEVVVNHRGPIVPILVLRSNFHLAALAYAPVSVVMILKNGRLMVGVVVDSVSDVVALGCFAIG
ncbi:chemotaxis protein CheW, partial [Pseudomonas aeruginosa]